MEHILIDVLVKPQQALKHVKKDANFGNGLKVLVIWSVLSSVILSAAAFFQAQTRFASAGIDATALLIDSFVSSEINFLLVFLIMAILVHVFLNAVNVKQKIGVFIGTLAYPFSAIIVLSSLFSVLIFLVSGITTQNDPIGFYIYLVLSATMMGLAIYGFLLYTLTISEVYRTSMATAAAVIILMALVVLSVVASPELAQSFLQFSGTFI
ncbi:MAG: hypothetical protein J4432_01220 [DPANN group archaeon]|nr:hypothetical protein [DPANN group archaeon]